MTQTTAELDAELAALSVQRTTAEAEQAALEEQIAQAYANGATDMTLLEQQIGGLSARQKGLTRAIELKTGERAEAAQRERIERYIVARVDSLRATADCAAFEQRVAEAEITLKAAQNELDHQQLLVKSANGRAKDASGEGQFTGLMLIGGEALAAANAEARRRFEAEQSAH